MDNSNDDETADDLPFTSSGVVDVNNIAEIPNATTLSPLAQLKANVTANVVTGSKILNQYDCDTLFHISISDYIALGYGKTSRCNKRGQTATAFKVGLFDATTFIEVCVSHFFSLTIRRFQAHSAFVVSSFDISRLNHNSSKTNVLTRHRTWPAMALLLKSLPAKQLMEAASQAEKHQPIMDPTIQELLKGVARVGSTASGSDERKSYMLARLKSSIVHFGCPIIFLTINPHERYSPIALFYAGEEIDIHKFLPKCYSLSQ